MGPDHVHETAGAHFESRNFHGHDDGYRACGKAVGIDGIDVIGLIQLSPHHFPMDSDRPDLNGVCRTEEDVRESARVVAQDERLLERRAPVLRRRGEPGSDGSDIEANERIPRIQPAIRLVAEPLRHVGGPRVRKAVRESPIAPVWNQLEASVLRLKQHGRE